MEEEKQDKNKKNNSKINSNNQKETPEFHSEKYKKKSEYPAYFECGNKDSGLRISGFCIKHVIQLI